MKWISCFSILSLSFLAACSPEVNKDNYKEDSRLSANVIYGTDGRLDVYQTTDDRLRLLADSTVALIRTTDLKIGSNVVSVLGKNYGIQQNLCPTEKFREQDTAAFCSGSLVGPDIILTAGHCVETLSDCLSMSVVFGFALKTAGVLPNTINPREVYRCKQIIKSVKTSGADFAVIQLDRAVTGHATLEMRTRGDIEPSAGLVVIGHPVGLPTKITTGGVVRAISTDYFTTNLDTFGGNSGSAVFNRDTGLIEGILVRGEQDFENRGNCVVSKICAEEACRGEDVTKISLARAFVPTTETPPAPVQPPTPVLASELFTSSQAMNIPDNFTTGIVSPLTVTSAPRGRKVIVSVHILHPYIGDLVVKVASSDGKTAVLHQRTGGNQKNINQSYDVTQTFGAAMNSGVYKLLVQDLAGQDVGKLVSWSVQFAAR